MCRGVDVHHLRELVTRRGRSRRDSVLDRDRYVGVYDSIWGQEAVVRWEDGLAMISLDSRNPKDDLQRLHPAAEHTFHRVRDDDESLGETVVFDVADDGSVTRFRQHSNWYLKVR